MPEWNQDAPGHQGGGAAPEPTPPAGERAAGPDPEPDARSRSFTERGLLGWLITISTGGIGGLLLGQQELSALMALAGLFVAAQAADQDPRWRPLYLALAWVVPLSAVLAFVSIGRLLGAGTLAEPYRTVLTGFAGWAAVVSALLWLPPVTEALVQVMFPGQASSHSLRLTARLVAMGYLLAVPAAVALRETLLELLRSPASPLTAEGFAGSLVGYVALALAGVGFMIRRDSRATIQRLGLRALGGRDLLVGALAVGALVALTSGADALQQRWLHPLWEQDQLMNEAIVGRLGVARALLLGVSAGVGEEITMRGALQPRLGLTRSSLLFAALHVQYTWYGILVIFLLGMVLGWVRARTSTSVAMLAHGAFDVVAVFTN